MCGQQGISTNTDCLTHQINTNSGKLQAAISLKKELRRETGLIKGIIAEKIKER